MSSFRNNLLETVEGKTRQASTVIFANTWLQSNGTGEFEPLTPGAPVVGLALEGIDATDPNFAVEGLIHVDMVTETVDRFLIDVTTGTADAEMEGLAFDIDAADAGGLDVSGAGTQFEVTRFITADYVEVRPLICCDPATS